MCAEKMAVTQQAENNSDKDNQFDSDCWAQECLVAGTRVQQDEHHHHGGIQEHQGVPGHAVQEEFGHMMDNPGKDSNLHHTKVFIPGQADHSTEAGHHGRAHHQQGVAGDGVKEVVNVQPHVLPDIQGERHCGVDCVQQSDQDLGKGGVGGGVVLDGAHSVLARVKDGFGGGVRKRTYWKKTSGVPDGLVQQRIVLFSTTSVSKLGGGNISAISTSGRKRKCLED